MALLWWILWGFFQYLKIVGITDHTINSAWIETSDSLKDDNFGEYAACRTFNLISITVCYS